MQNFRERQCVLSLLNSKSESLAAEYVWCLWDFETEIPIVLTAEETVVLVRFWATKPRPNRIDEIFVDPTRVYSFSSHPLHYHPCPAVSSFPVIINGIMNHDRFSSMKDDDEEV